MEATYVPFATFQSALNTTAAEVFMPRYPGISIRDSGDTYHDAILVVAGGTSRPVRAHEVSGFINDCK